MRYKNYKTLNTVLEPVDIIILIGATSTSITLSITGTKLIVLPISAGIACALSIGSKVLHKILINKYNKDRRQFDKDRQTIKSFDKLYRKSLQDNVYDKNEYESLRNIFTNYVDETKNETFSLFYKFEYKGKINFLIHNQLKLNPEPRTWKVADTFQVSCYDSCNCYVTCELLRFM